MLLLFLNFEYKLERSYLHIHSLKSAYFVRKHYNMYLFWNWDKDLIKYTFLNVIVAKLFTYLISFVWELLCLIRAQ